MSSDIPRQQIDPRREGNAERSRARSSGSSLASEPRATTTCPECLVVPQLRLAEYRFVLRCQSMSAETHSVQEPHQHSDPWYILSKERR